MNLPLSSLSLISNRVGDYQHYEDAAWYGDYLALQEKLIQLLNKQTEPAALAEQLLNDHHLLMMKIMLWTYKELVDLEYLREETQVDHLSTLSRLKQSVLSSALIKKTISIFDIDYAYAIEGFDAFIKEIANIREEERLKSIEAYTELQSIPFHVFTLILGMSPAIDHLDLSIQSISTTHKAHLSIISTYIIINSLKDTLPTTYLESVIDYAHQMVELNAAYSLLLKQSPIPRNLPDQTKRNIEIVASTLSLQYDKGQTYSAAAFETLLKEK